MSKAPAGEATAPELGLSRELFRAGVAWGVYAAADGAARAVSLVLTLLYTRYLTPAEYSTIAITSTVVLLLMPVLGLTISAAVLRLWFRDESDEARRRLVASALGFLVVVPTLLVGAIELAGDTGALDFFPTAHYSPYLRYAVLTAYASLFLDLPVTILIARRRPQHVFVLTVMGAALTLATSLTLVIGLHEGVVGFLRANLIAAAVMGVIGIAVTLRMTQGRMALDRGDMRTALAYSTPLIPSQLAHWVLQVSDRPLLAHFVAAAAVGRYYLGYSVAAIAGLVIHGATRALQPMMTRDLHAGADRRVARLGTYWFGALTAVCLALALWGHDALVLLTRSEFHSAARIVPVVAAAHVAFAAYVIVGQGIFFGMRTRWIPLQTGLAASLNVGLNLLLIPRFGIMAAAVDTVVGFAALAVLFALLAHRVYRIDWEYLRWARIVVAAVAAFGLASLAGQSPSWPRFGLELAGMLAAAPAALTVLGFWTPRERHTIAALARRAGGLRW